ncbi:MAG: hypothetical protein M3P18_26045, partial [Actinomycetota bacterium]|nr:hypothetical protein [Actinomycetota bacterium]
MNPLTSVAVGFIFGLPLVWSALHVGRRIGLLDVPTGIKVHQLPIPYTGGAAIAATLTVASIVFELPPPFLLGGLFIWFVGLVDDVLSLPPRTKLLLELPPLVIGASVLGLEPLVLIASVMIGLLLVNCFN